MQAIYKKQVALLLNVLPEVAKEECFALHGGTAINLFVRNMPRLSVDIDLTYLPIEDRETSVKAVSEALERIKSNIERVIPGANVTHRKDAAKLQVSANQVDIKLEVNLTNRGALSAPRKMPLCDKAQAEFETFCEMPVVSLGQLYGVPNFQDQRAAMDNHFSGMTDEEFGYEEYERVKDLLIQTLYDSLTEKDKEFILSVKNVTPNWAIYDFERFPGIQWKLRNLKKLKEQNPEKHRAAYEALEKKLKK